MGRNLVVLFDGTWNSTKDKTNVVRFRDLLASSGRDDPAQPCFYDAGVGTHWHDRMIGGAFGFGVSRNIRQGYAWLCSKHQIDDRVFVLGFSRGAYTARSLVGLIRKCGLLNTPDDNRVKAAYELYRDKNVAPDDPKALQFRAAHSREIRVRFIGVWDTVGALGVPITGVPFSRDDYTWHDTKLSKIVDYAYHAIATDERRRDYEVATWQEIKPENIDVEQRWFVGAHSNVGGGYDHSPPDTLPNPPLRWMQDKAEAAGLKIREKALVDNNDVLAPVTNSFKEFMAGIYKWFKKPFDRPFGKGVRETVDASVWRRWKVKPDYRPATFSSHPDKPA